jgi:hypothetical protein
MSRVAHTTDEPPGHEAIAEGFKSLAAARGYGDHETARRERHLLMLFTCIAVVIPESCGETKHATDRLRENIT